jgi:hypothetical protein
MFRSVTWPSSSCCRHAERCAASSVGARDPSVPFFSWARARYEKTLERKGSRDRLFSAPVAVKSASAAATASSTFPWRNSVVSTSSDRYTSTSGRIDVRGASSFSSSSSPPPATASPVGPSSSMATLPTPAASASTASSPAGASGSTAICSRRAKRPIPSGTYLFTAVVSTSFVAFCRSGPLCLRARPINRVWFEVTARSIIATIRRKSSIPPRGMGFGWAGEGGGSVGGRGVRRCEIGRKI